MKLALVSLNTWEGDPTLGLAYLASYLRKYGNYNDIVIIDKEDPIKAIQREKPDVVGISSMTYEYPQAKKVAAEIKSKFNIPLILGGHHISLMPHHFDNNFDLAVLGEGEQTLLELMNLFDRHGSFPKDKLKNIKGIEYRDGSLKMTENRPFIENIDEVPFPARDLFKMKDYYLTVRKATYGKFGISLSMLTSRGCPYKCAFCSIATFWKRARFHSAEYVVNEMKHLIDNYKVDGILLYDDLFIANKKRIEEIVKLIRQEGIHDKVEFHAYCRANLINNKICKLMKDMNVSTVEFGLESGSEKSINYLKGGSVTVEQNRNALKTCKSFGFKTIGSFIIGSPDETEEDLKKTMDLVKNKNLDGAHVYQLTPYPGTKVWEYAKSKGFVSDDPNFDLQKIYLRQVKTDILLTDKINKDKFVKWYKKFQEEVTKKNYNINMNIAFSKIKAKHIGYMLKPRFIKKVLSHWKEIPSYIKHSLSKKEKNS